MRTYEVVYIFHPALDEVALEERLARFHALLTQESGSEITAVDDWGVRQMAYGIRDQSQGRYVVVQFTAPQEALPEFERILRLEDDLLRYLLVLSLGEPTTGMSILAEIPEAVAARKAEQQEEDDEDDDEEEDEEDYVPESDDGSPPEFSGGRGKRRRVEGPRIELLNYKDVASLSRFVTEQGKILPKRTTKVTARFQRDLGTAVKRARYLALLPYVQNHDR